MTVARKARALFISFDFLLGVVGGFGIGILPAVIPSLLENAVPLLLTLAAIAAALAALVLTPMTSLLSSLSPPMLQILRKAPDGVAGALVPFAQVAVVSALGCVTALVVTILTPLAAGTYWFIIWVAASVPLALTFWALLGCIQVTQFLITMVRKSEFVDELAARKDAASKRVG